MKFLPKEIIKISLFIFTFLFLFFTLKTPIHAYLIKDIEPVTSGTGNDVQFYKNYFQRSVLKKDEVNKESTDYNTWQNGASSLLLLIFGPDQNDPEVRQMVEAYQKEGNPIAQGALPTTFNLMASLTSNPPVNTSEYLADLGSSLGLAKPAYAQGTGFSALDPVMKIWKAFRNISYMAFVILFIVLGFAIMFRTKINPQTVISIQEALPRIIITLVLITFSYAIASLMIDLIYVVIYLAVGIFASAGLLLEGGKPALDRIFEMNVWQIVFRGRNVFVSNPAKAVADIAFNLGGTIGAIVAALGGVQALVNVVLAVIIFFMMMKLFMSLLVSYVSIILSVVFAPFSLLLNVFPGSNSFTAWITNLLANVAVFPTAAIMFLLAAILVGPVGEGACGVNPLSSVVQPPNPWCVAEDVGYTRAKGSGVYGGGEARGWTPPFLIGMYTGSGGAMSSADTVLALIGIGIILLTPHTVDLVKKSLKVQPSPLAGVLGAAPGAVIGAPGRAVQTGTQFLYQAHYARGELASLLGGIEKMAEGLKARRGVGKPGEAEPR